MLLERADIGCAATRRVNGGGRWFQMAKRLTRGRPPNIHFNTTEGNHPELDRVKFWIDQEAFSVLQSKPKNPNKATAKEVTHKGSKSQIVTVNLGNSQNAVKKATWTANIGTACAWNPNLTNGSVVIGDFRFAGYLEIFYIKAKMLALMYQADVMDFGMFYSVGNGDITMIRRTASVV